VYSCWRFKPDLQGQSKIHKNPLDTCGHAWLLQAISKLVLEAKATMDTPTESLEAVLKASS